MCRAFGKMIGIMCFAIVHHMSSEPEYGYPVVRNRSVNPVIPEMGGFCMHPSLNNIWEFLNGQPTPEPVKCSQVRWDTEFAVEDDTGVLIERIHIKSRLPLI